MEVSGHKVHNPKLVLLEHYFSLVALLHNGLHISKKGHSFLGFKDLATQQSLLNYRPERPEVADFAVFYLIHSRYP